MKNKIISVNLVDDHELVTNGLRLILSSQRSIKVLDVAHSGEQLLEQLEQRQPDVIIMDYSLSNEDDLESMNGLDAAKKVIPAYPKIKIMMLSMHTSGNYIVPCVECGVQGYMIKGEKDFDIAHAIRELMERGHYFSPEIASLLATDIKGNREARIDLSDREHEVLSEIFNGNSAKEIGDILNISPRTVEGHRKNIMNKFDAKNMMHLIRKALQAGILRINSKK